MYYISRIINKFLRRVTLIIKITLGSLFDIIKLILSPLYLLVKLIKWLFIPRRAGFFPSNKRRRKTDFQKTDKYRTWAKQNKPYLTKDSLLKDVQSLHHQINDPLGGIINIQKEHSKYIQKKSKNQIHCLEDNQDIILKKMQSMETDINELKSGANILIKCVEGGQAIEKDIKTLHGTIETLEKKVNTINVYEIPNQDISNEQLSNKIKALEDENNASRIDSIEDTLNKNIKLEIETNELRGEQYDILLKAMKSLENKMEECITIKELREEYGNPNSVPQKKEDIIKFKLSDFKGDTEGDKVRQEEYDYHQEEKYWSERAKQAYDDYMSEPREFHDE